LHVLGEPQALELQHACLMVVAVVVRD